MGRGGRVVLDRVSTTMDDLWSSLDFKIFDSEASKMKQQQTIADQQQQQPSDSIAGVDEGGALVSVKSEPNESDSVVVDLIPPVNSRKYSVDSSVARTKGLTTGVGENIVIKSEQHTVLNIKQESLDEWASCASTAAAYSLPSTPHSVSQPRFSAVTASGAGNLFSAALRRTVSQSGSQPSNTSNCSRTLIRSAHTTNSSFNLTKSDSLPSRLSIEASAATGHVISNCAQPEDDTKSLPYDECTRKEDDMFSDFLNEIQRDWLHFRPKTPPPRTEDCDDNNEFGEPAIEYSDRTQLQVEIQCLGSQPPSAMLDENDPNSLLLLNDGDNVFLTNPFSLDELMDETDDQLAALDVNGSGSIHLNRSLSSSGNEINLSGDSLPELSLSLGENEANEKMLENILEECQFDDLKSNFWNGILEDAGALCEDLDDVALKKTAFDKIATDIIGVAPNRSSKHKPHRLQSRIGCSSFSISNVTKDEFFKKEIPTTTNSTEDPPLANDSVVHSEIKQEIVCDGAVSTSISVPAISTPNQLISCPPLIGAAVHVVHQPILNNSPATNNKNFIKMEPPDEFVDTVKYVKNQLIPNVVKTEMLNSSSQLPQIVNVQPGGSIVIQHQGQQHLQPGIQLQLMQPNKQPQQISLQHQQQQQHQLHTIVQQPQQQQQIGQPKTFVIQQQHQTIQLQPQNNQSVGMEGTLLVSTSNPSTIRRQTNGPVDKNCKYLQKKNIFKQSPFFKGNINITRFLLTVLLTNYYAIT